MGSPLSGILFLEFQESGSFKFKIPKVSNDFHYINILLMYPWNNYLTKIPERFDKTKHIIDFTYELENSNILPFLDILRINNNN